MNYFDLGALMGTSGMHVIDPMDEQLGEPLNGAKVRLGVRSFESVVAAVKDTRDLARLQEEFDLSLLSSEELKVLFERAREVAG